MGKYPYSLVLVIVVVSVLSMVAIIALTVKQSGISMPTFTPTSGSDQNRVGAAIAVVSPPASFSDTFNRPDSTTLGNGWSEVKGDFYIQSNELRNTNAKGYHMAILPGLSNLFVDTSVSFAPSDLSASPRFGVILYYKDPNNYYLAYRQTGGTSALRISQVSNGVEKVLKSVSIPNPAKNSYFRMRVVTQQASSATSIKVSVGNTEAYDVEGLDPNGSFGILVGSSNNAAGSLHRIDNFTASTSCGAYCPPICTNQCTLGAITCTDWDHAMWCVTGASGCTEWNPSTCGAGRACFNSTCTLQPGLQILSPNGGENWQGGTNQSIQVSLGNNQHTATYDFVLKASPANGYPDYFFLQNGGEVNFVPSGSHLALNVVVPNVPSGTYKVYGRVVNNGQQTAEDTSDSAFSITACTNQCVLGTSTCIDWSTAQFCITGTNGCTQWSPITTCGTGMACTNGTCRPQQAACTSNAECEDGLACTTNFCVNPGLANASCGYFPVPPSCANPSTVACGQTIVSSNGCGTCASGTYCSGGGSCQGQTCVYPSQTCTDSDGGIQPYLRGNIYGTGANGTAYNYQDYCLNSSLLIEDYCNATAPAWTYITATYQLACSNGALINTSN